MIHCTVEHILTIPQGTFFKDLYSANALRKKHLVKGKGASVALTPTSALYLWKMNLRHLK